MDIEKQKLPKGRSYPLKTSILEKMLAEHGIVADTVLYYSISRIFFDAQYNSIPEVANSGRLTIRVGDVQSDRCKEARQYLLDVVLPEMIKWIRKIDTIPAGGCKMSGDLYFRRDFE